MDLRPYVDRDLDRLLDLTCEVFGPFYEDSFRPAVGDPIFVHQHGSWREDYRRQLSGLHAPQDHRHVVLAEDGGTLVGFSGWEVDPVRRHGHVEFVAVRASHRQHHVATWLCEHVFDAMRADGVEVVELGTGGDDFHAPARALYDSLGMTAVPVTVYFKQL